jgi:hypothetical protein
LLTFFSLDSHQDDDEIEKEGHLRMQMFNAKVFEMKKTIDSLSNQVKKWTLKTKKRKTAYVDWKTN